RHPAALPPTNRRRETRPTAGSRRAGAIPWTAPPPSRASGDLADEPKYLPAIAKVLGSWVVLVSRPPARRITFVYGGRYVACLQFGHGRRLREIVAVVRGASPPKSESANSKWRSWRSRLVGHFTSRGGGATSGGGRNARFTGRLSYTITRTAL